MIVCAGLPETIVWGIMARWSRQSSGIFVTHEPDDELEEHGNAP